MTGGRFKKKDLHNLERTDDPEIEDFFFGGKFLEAVDLDLTMNKRAKEVANRFKPRQSDLRSFRDGRSSFFSGQRGSRSRTGG